MDKKIKSIKSKKNIKNKRGKTRKNIKGGGKNTTSVIPQSQSNNYLKRLFKFIMTSSVSHNKYIFTYFDIKLIYLFIIGYELSKNLNEIYLNLINCNNYLNKDNNAKKLILTKLINIIRDIYKSDNHVTEFFNDQNRFIYNINENEKCDEYKLFDIYINNKKQAIYNFLYKYRSDNNTKNNNSCKQTETPQTETPQTETACNLSTGIFQKSYKKIFNDDGTLKINVFNDNIKDKITALIKSPVIL